MSFVRRATGALGGAATGAQLGSIVPGIGTAIGAGIGGLIGLFGSGEPEKSPQEIAAEQMAERAKALADRQRRDAEAMMVEAEMNRRETAGALSGIANNAATGAFERTLSNQSRLIRQGATAMASGLNVNPTEALIQQGSALSAATNDIEGRRMSGLLENNQSAFRNRMSAQQMRANADTVELGGASGALPFLNKSTPTADAIANAGLLSQLGNSLADGVKLFRNMDFGGGQNATTTAGTAAATPSSGGSSGGLQFALNGGEQSMFANMPEFRNLTPQAFSSDLDSQNLNSYLDTPELQTFMRDSGVSRQDLFSRLRSAPTAQSRADIVQSLYDNPMRSPLGAGGLSVISRAGGGMVTNPAGELALVGDNPDGTPNQTSELAYLAPGSTIASAPQTQSLLGGGAQMGNQMGNQMGGMSMSPADAMRQKQAERDALLETALMESELALADTDELTMKLIEGTGLEEFFAKAKPQQTQKRKSALPALA
jgi:hypothetical protein